ncbi:MAG: ATP-dependent helicase [Firmicutes bacterium]|nr:ATP-dependent helicase [Bacillota bacterium]
MIKDYNIKLNKQQESAVNSIDGATLLLAVPGSGKTTTLVARLGHMIFDLGIDPASILTLTYTNAATEDMRKRFESFFGDEKQVEFRTINSLCNGIIRTYATRYGRNAFELEKENARIITEIYRQVYQEFPSELERNEAVRQIAYIKNMMLPKAEIKKLKIGEHSIEPLYDAYNELMRRQRLMDFDDQLVYALNILKKHGQLLEYYQEKYRYILVDEAQDTSKVQHEIIKLLASKYKNIFMVGDEDQSIYGFRAAYPEALLEFENVYPSAKILLLEENYRSTQQIVNAANGFIDVNKKRKKKQMRTDKTDGQPIRYVQLTSRFGQYAYLLKLLEGCDAKTAILYRNNESAIPLVYHFQKAGLPFNIRGVDATFFSHKVVRDVKDFIAFAKDPADEDIFMRIYFKMGMAIKRENAIAAIRNFDPDVDYSLFDALIRCFGKPKKVKGWSNDSISQLRQMKWDTADKALARIEYDIRQTNALEHDKFFILRAIAEKGESIESYLAKLDSLEAQLAGGIRSPGSEITLSTIHASKGLEYDNVYVIDAIEGILPSPDGDLEEERRMFYVAITRAKEQLTIFSYKSCKDTFVKLLQNPVKETRIKVGSGYKTRKMPKVSACLIAKCQEGTRVKHRSEGAGTIISRQGSIATIKFDSGVTKKFDLETVLSKKIIEV